MECRSPIRLTIATVGISILAVALSACSGTETSRPGSAAPAATVTTTATLVRSVTANKTVTEPIITTVDETVTAPAVTDTLTVTITEEAAPTQTEPDADSPPSSLKIGGPGVTASDTDGAASVAVLSVKRETKALGEYDGPPKQGNYVIFDIVYTGTQGAFNYNPFDWTVRDPDGRAYDADAGFGFEGQSLHSGTLAKGSKARGFVIFDAPKGPLMLEYSPSFMGPPATWTVPG